MSTTAVFYPGSLRVSAALLSHTFIHVIKERYKGSRREAFISAVKIWWPAIRKAYAYDSQHRYRRFQKNVSQNNDESERLYGVPQTDTTVVMPVHPDDTVVLPRPVDPWLEYMTRAQKNRTMIIGNLEGPLNSVDLSSSVLGRDPDRTSQEPCTAEFVRTVEGWGDYYGSHGQDRRGRLQRPTGRISSRQPAMQHLVPKSKPDPVFIPGLYRLPDAPRGSERTLTQ